MAHVYVYQLPEGQAVIRAAPDSTWQVAYEGHRFSGSYSTPQAALNAVHSGEAKWMGAPAVSPADDLPQLLGQWSPPA